MVHRRLPGDVWQRWRQLAIASDLRQPEIVEKLWCTAIEWGVLPETEQNRVEFFNAAVHDSRIVKRRAPPGSVFATNVAQQRWNASAEDADIGKAMRRQLERAQPVTEQPEVKRPTVEFDDVRIRHYIAINQKRNTSVEEMVAFLAGRCGRDLDSIRREWFSDSPHQAALTR